MPNKLDIGVWGPNGWNFLHAVSFAYPVNPTGDERRTMSTFLSATSKVLPCKTCCTHFANYLAYLGPNLESTKELSSRQELTKLLVDVHNTVNARLGKRVLSYEHVKRDFERLQSSGCSYRIVFLFLILFILLTYWHVQNRRRQELLRCGVSVAKKRFCSP